MKLLREIVLIGAMALGCANVDDQEKVFEVSNAPSGAYTKNTDNYGLLQVRARFPTSLKRSSYFIDGKEYEMDIKENNGLGEAVAREYLSPNFLEEGGHEFRLVGVTVDGRVYEENRRFIVDNTNPIIRVNREDGRFYTIIEDNFPGFKYSLFAVGEGKGDGEKKSIRKIEDYEILKKEDRKVEISLNINRLKNNEGLLVLVSDAAGNMGKHEDG